jgi:hypothetical protein
MQKAIKAMQKIVSIPDATFSVHALRQKLVPGTSKDEGIALNWTLKQNVFYYDEWLGGYD